MRFTITNYDGRSVYLDVGDGDPQIISARHVIDEAFKIATGLVCIGIPDAISRAPEKRLTFDITVVEG